MDIGDESGDNEVSEPKTKSSGNFEEGTDYPTKRSINGIVLSVTKPSFTLKRGIGMGKARRSLRWEHRKNLQHLLRQLVRRQNWDEASGVLSVLLKATLKETSISKNRTKYWATMELLEHLSNFSMNPRKIQHVYEIWMKKIISVKSAAKESFAVQSEFILFSLANGDTNSAYQAIISLMQERKFGHDPVSNFVVGLVFFRLWDTAIRKELQLEDLDASSSLVQSEILRCRRNMSIDNRKGKSSIEVKEADCCPDQHDSSTSVRIDKKKGSEEAVHQNLEVSMEMGDNEKKSTNHDLYQQGFFANSVESDRSEKSSFSFHDGDSSDASIFHSHALEPWLLPLRLPLTNDLDDFIHMQRIIHNDNYKGAVKHLKIALHSTPPVHEALLPLVQLLLLGDQVKEAIDEVEEFVRISDAAFSLRLKTSLFENFFSNDHVTLLTSFEEILKRDPTCSHSLSRLINMHHDGFYSTERLLERVALHLDATFAEASIWKEFASCFLELSQCEEDRMSTCENGSAGGTDQSCSRSFGRIPEMFANAVSRQDWTLRCRWWLTRHFSRSMLVSDIDSGDLEILAYKAAAACHLYGRAFDYAVKASACLGKEKNMKMLSILNVHMQTCVGFYLNFNNNRN